MMFLNRWLPIIFGCHTREDRSFYLKGRKFPICARCTGELIGILASLILYPLIKLSLPIALLLMLPMILDGALQSLSRYESNNTKRFITGFLFGYSLAWIFVYTSVIAFEFGYRYSGKI